MSELNSIRKIDIHAHILSFPEQGKPEATGINADELVAMYDQLGIERGVVLPLVSANGTVSPSPTEMADFVLNKYPDRFDWFCNVNPHGKCVAELTEEINTLKALGAKGVGEITTNVDVDDPILYNLFAACAACQMPVIVHLVHVRGKGYGMYDDLGLPRIEKLLADLPDLTLIGHSTVFWSEISGDVTEASRCQYPTGPVTEGGRVVELMRTYPNLYCDVSAGSGHNALMRDPDFTAQFIEAFSDRILYGCDITATTVPHPLPFVDFLERMVSEGKISETNYRKLVRDNAIRILHLNR